MKENRRSSNNSDSIRPTKRFGQHFLTDPRTIDRIVNALKPASNETILEIGPGKGALTEKLVARAGNLVAVELDRQLIPFLNERFGSHHNFKLVHEDALTVELCNAIA